MTETTFTPAPWVMANSDYFNEATNSHLVVKTENDDWEICHLCDGIEGSIGEIMIANGHLIAQAPAMFEELSKMEKLLVGLVEDGWALKTKLDSVRKILTAARGETTINT